MTWWVEGWRLRSVARRHLGNPVACLSFGLVVRASIALPQP